MKRILKKINQCTNEELLTDYQETKDVLSLVNFNINIQPALNKIYDLEQELKSRGINPVQRKK